MDQVLYGIDYIEYYFYWIYYKFIGYPLIIRICSIAVMFCIIAYLFLLFHIIYGIFKRRKEKRKYNKAFDKYYEEMKAHGKDVKPLDKEAMLEYVQKSGGKIIANKGATFYAVSASVCRLCGLLLSAYDSTATVSSMMHGEYGIDDVCLSTLSMIGPNGLKGKVPVPLTDEEVEKLKKSADALKSVIAQIEL